MNINELLEVDLDFKKIENLYKLLKIRSTLFYKSLGEALNFKFSEEDAIEQFIKNFEYVYTNPGKQELIESDLNHIKNKIKEQQNVI